MNDIGCRDEDVVKPKGFKTPWSGSMKICSEMGLDRSETALHFRTSFTISWCIFIKAVVEP